MDDKIVVGLDIGSTKVCVVAGRKNEYGKIEILGMGKTPLEEGVVRAGVVTKIDRTAQAVQQAMRDLQAGMEGEIRINAVNANIGSTYIKGTLQRGGLTRRSAQAEIGVQDISQLNDDMYQTTPPLGSQVIHVMPQTYRVDDENGVKDPVGMLGVRLEADFYIINAQTNVLKNMEMCVQRLGLEVEQLVFAPLAASLATLLDDEKERGVVLVDVGGGTTDVVVYHEGIVRHIAVLPFGGEAITRDIAHGCGVTKLQAEAMKTKYGMATPEAASHQDRIEVPGLRDRLPTMVSMKTLSTIIEARLSEIVEMVYAEIVRSGYESRVRNVGIVLVGGTAMLGGIQDLFEDLTGMPTRIGYAHEHLGQSRTNEIKHPAFATSVGLVLAGFRALDARENRYQQLKPAVQAKTETTPRANGGIFGKLKTWLTDDTNDSADY